MIQTLLLDICWATCSVSVFTAFLYLQLISVFAAFVYLQLVSVFAGHFLNAAHVLSN